MNPNPNPTEHILRRITDGFIGHIEHHPAWPADERAQHIIRQDAADLLRRHRALYNDAVRAWHYPIGEPRAALRAAADNLIEQGKRRTARLRAREAHAADRKSITFTGPDEQADRPPSGCARCGRPERSHGRIWHRASQRFETHVRPDESTILVRMRVRRSKRAARLRAAGFTPCGVCRVPRDIHPAEHRVYVGADGPFPFSAPPQDWERGPWETPSDGQVIAYATGQLSHRWDYLYPEDWMDEGAEAEMDAIRAEALLEDHHAEKHED